LRSWPDKNQIFTVGSKKFDKRDSSTRKRPEKQWEVQMHYLLFYEAGDDYVSRRAEFRDAHLEKAWKATEHGELLLVGALANPVDGAVLLFQGDSPEVAEKFASSDPYVTSGAVKRWHVREWTTVVGQNAATPVGPIGKDRSWHIFCL
jgi:uncharacterized protein YciI